MRPLIAFVLFVAACTPAAGPTGPAGERGPQGEPGAAADVSALRAELDAVKVQLAAVKVVKVPHLVDTEDGTDLGVMLTLTRVWDDRAGEVDPFTPLPVYFSDTGCRGDAVIGGNVRARLHVVSPWRTLLRSTGIREQFKAQSWRVADGSCQERTDGNFGSPYVDTGIAYVPRDSSSTTVEMR